MITKNLNDLMGQLNLNGVIISFNGSFTQGIIEEMGEAIKAYLDNEKPEDESRVYDVFSVYIEQSQNIKNYFLKKSEQVMGKGAQIGKMSFESIIIIGREQDNYYVCSGNLIEDSEIDDLKRRIDQVNSLPKDELRKLYKAKLREARQEGDNAGLGIIEMSRKACQNLDYAFTKRDGDFSFFSLKVTI
jgi:hypothetical protein